MEKTPGVAMNQRHLGAPYIKALAGIVVLLAVLALSAHEGLAQVFRWVDENGNTHYAGAKHNIPELYRSGVKPIDAGNPPDLPRPKTSTPISKTTGSPTTKNQSFVSPQQSPDAEAKIALLPKPELNETKPAIPQASWWVLWTSRQDTKGHSGVVWWEGDSWAGCQVAGADYYRSITSHIVQIKPGLYVDGKYARSIKLVVNEPGHLSYLLKPHNPDQEWTRVAYSWVCKQVR